MYTVDFANPEDPYLVPYSREVSEEVFRNYRLLRHLRSVLNEEHPRAGRVPLYAAPDGRSMCVNDPTGTRINPTVLIGEEHLNNISTAIWVYLHEFTHGVQIVTDRLRTFSSKKWLHTRYVFDGAEGEWNRLSHQQHAALPFEQEADRFANTNFEHSHEVLCAPIFKQEEWMKHLEMGIPERVDVLPSSGRIVRVDELRR